MATYTLNDAFEEIQSEARVSENLRRWADLLPRCRSAKELALSSAMMIDDQPGSILACFIAQLSVAFEAGRLYGRSELIRELQKEIK